MKALKNPPSQRMVQKDLNYLKEQGLIVMKGVGKKIRWVIR